jgi:hypothetical protein
MPLAALRRRQVHPRIVRGGRLRQPGQQTRLRPVQPLRRLAEVALAGLDDPPAAVAEVDRVEVHLQDLGLGVAPLQLEGEPDLPQFDERASPGTGVEPLGELLGDGGAARVPPTHAGHPVPRDPQHTLQVDAVVGVEALVLCRHDRPCQPARRRGPDRPAAVLPQDRPHPELRVSDARQGRQERCRGDDHDRGQAAHDHHGDEHPAASLPMWWTRPTVGGGLSGRRLGPDVHQSTSIPAPSEMVGPAS